MRKRGLVAGALALVVIVAAVAAAVIHFRPGDDSAEDLEWYLTIGSSYSDQGVLYRGENDQGISNYLHYLDAATGRDILICNDASCTHKRDECSAYMDALSLFGIVEGKKLILVTDYEADRYGELYLYEAAINGTDRRRIAKLSDNIQAITQVVIEKDYILIGYYNQYDENMEDMALPIAGIYCYDRNTGEGRNIYEAEMWNARILSLTIQDEMVYFSFLGYEIGREEALEHASDPEYMDSHQICAVFQVDVNGDNLSGMQDCEEAQLSGLYGDSWFYIDQGVLYMYDVRTGETTIIGQGMRLVPTYLDDVVYLTRYDSETGRATLYSFDGELTECGRLQESWSLYAVFPHVAYAYYYGEESESSGLNCLKKVDSIIE